MTIEYKDSKRIVGLSSDVADTITFEDDTFSSGWTSTGSDVVTGTNVIDFDFSNSNATNTISYDLGSTMSDTNWVLRFKLIMDNYNVGSSGNSAGGFFGLFSADHATNDNATQDSIMMNIRATSAGSSYHKYYYADCDGETPRNKLGGDGSFTHTPTEETLYVEIKRTSSTAYTINLYSDSSYSTLVESKTGACASTVTGLRYIKFMNLNSASVSDHNIDGTIDDIKFYNGVSSLTNKPTNVQDNSILVEKDTARRYWFDANPLLDDDFSTDDWTDSGTNPQVTGGEMVWSVNSAVDANSYYALPITASNNSWVLRCKITINNYSLNTDGTGQEFSFGLSDETTIPTNSKDAIVFRLRTGSSTAQYQLIDVDGGSLSGGAPSQAFSRTLSAETIYVELIRTSTTTYKANIYSDSAYSILLESQSTTCPSTITNLRYINFYCLENDGTSNGTLDGICDDIEFYNGVTTASGGGFWTMQPTYEDDFSSSTGWTTVGSNVTITGGELSASSANAATDNRVHRALGFTLEDNFVARWEHTPEGVSSNSVFFPIMNFTAGTGNLSTSTNQDRVYLFTDGSSNTLYLRGQDGTTAGTNSNNQALTTDTKYYLEFVKNGTSGTLYVRTGSHSGTLVNTLTATIASGIIGLTHIQSGAMSGGNAGTGSYTVDNLQIYNGVTSIN